MQNENKNVEEVQGTETTQKVKKISLNELKKFNELSERISKTLVSKNEGITLLTMVKNVNNNFLKTELKNEN